MRRILTFLVLAALLLLPGRASAAIAVVAHTGAGLGQNGGTSGAIDTTGANAVFIAYGFYGPDPDITDSKGNSWTKLTQYGGMPGIHLAYSAVTSVGAGHTFSLSCLSCYVSITVLAVSGAHATPYDGLENGNTAVAAASILTGSSGVPSASGALIITAADIDGSTTATVDAAFTVSDQVTYSAGSFEGVAMAYEIQGSATARNPTWTTGGFDTAATIAVFKSAVGGGGGGGGSGTGLLLLGVGR